MLGKAAKRLVAELADEQRGEDADDDVAAGSGGVDIDPACHAIDGVSVIQSDARLAENVFGGYTSHEQRGLGFLERKRGWECEAIVASHDQVLLWKSERLY
jgi:hypothetical protein